MLKKNLKKISENIFELRQTGKGETEEQPVEQDLKTRYSKKQIKDIYEQIKSQTKAIRDNMAKTNKKLENFDVKENEFTQQEVEDFKKITEYVKYLDEKEKVEKNIESMKEKLNDITHEKQMIENIIPELKRKSDK